MARTYRTEDEDRQIARLRETVVEMKNTIRRMAARIDELERWQAEDLRAWSAMYVSGRRRNSDPAMTGFSAADRAGIKINRQEGQPHRANGIPDRKRHDGAVQLGRGKFWINGVNRQRDREA